MATYPQQPQTQLQPLLQPQQPQLQQPQIQLQPQLQNNEKMREGKSGLELKELIYELKLPNSIANQLFDTFSNANVDLKTLLSTPPNQLKDTFVALKISTDIQSKIIELIETKSLKAIKSDTNPYFCSAILFAEFDAILGPKITYQEPERLTQKFFQFEF